MAITWRLATIGDEGRLCAWDVSGVMRYGRIISVEQIGWRTKIIATAGDGELFVELSLAQVQDFENSA